MKNLFAHFINTSNPATHNIEDVEYFLDSAKKIPVIDYRKEVAGFDSTNKMLSEKYFQIELEKELPRQFTYLILEDEKYLTQLIPIHSTDNNVITLLFDERRLVKYLKKF